MSINESGLPSVEEQIMWSSSFVPLIGQEDWHKVSNCWDLTRSGKRRKFSPQPFDSITW
jgi:hypothetical protein